MACGQVSRPQSATSPDDVEQLARLRYTCAHVLAMAVQTLFPETKVTIGPCTETEFYDEGPFLTPWNDSLASWWKIMRGFFPLWQAPVQMRLLPVSDAQKDYANQVAETLKQAGFRVEVDTSGERLGKQMPTAELEKIPVISVIS